MPWPRVFSPARRWSRDTSLLNTCDGAEDEGTADAMQSNINRLAKLLERLHFPL
ncbi:hypothetical protein JJQ67_24045, partial [Enterobacter hormaechei]|nr:hypothetical protein [Enterobacter hormaechei]